MDGVAKVAAKLPKDEKARIQQIDDKAAGVIPVKDIELGPENGNSGDQMPNSP